MRKFFLGEIMKKPSPHEILRLVSDDRVVAVGFRETRNGKSHHVWQLRKSPGTGGEILGHVYPWLKTNHAQPGFVILSGSLFPKRFVSLWIGDHIGR